MDTKQRIIQRRALYKSLQRRGLASEDSDTKAVGGSLFDDMRQFTLNPNKYSEPQLAKLADGWFHKTLQIYNDPKLSFAPPNGWRDFLLNLKRMSLKPREMGISNSANIIKQALGVFATELTAIDSD